MNYADISKTYVINLKERQDRLLLAKEEMNVAGIDFLRLPAIKDEDGAEGLKRTFKALFLQSLAKEEKYIMVFEDDVLFIEPHVRLLIQKSIEQLPEDFHILQLGCNLLIPPIKYSSNLLKVNASYALHAAIYSNEAMRLILEVIDNKEPIDVSIMRHIQIKGKCFTSYPMLATQRSSESDIFKYDEEKHLGIGKYYDSNTRMTDWGLFMQDQWQRLTKNIN